MEDVKRNGYRRRKWTLIQIPDESVCDTFSR